MIKKVAVLVFFILLLPTLAFAQGSSAGVERMAAYFPADTVIFGAMRTDEAFVGMLESLSQPAIDLAQANGQPVQTLRESLNEGLANVGTDLDTVMSWLGGAAAFGIQASALATPATSPQGFYFVVEVDDRAGAQAFAETALRGRSTSAEQGDYTIVTPDAANEPVFAISDSLMLIYPTGMAMPLLTREARLDSNSSFQSAVGALPDAPYNVLVYADPSVFTQTVPVETFTFPLETAPLAVGLTILDGRSYVIDSAQLPLPGAAVERPPAVDPDFAHFIPGNASAVVQATDLSGLYANAIAFVDKVNSANSQSSAPAVSAQVQQLFAMLGFDLQDDLLSWTTGNYALFMRTDLFDLLSSSLAGGTPDLSGLVDKFDFGLVIEATDSAKAQAFAAKLGTLLQQMVARQQGVAISSETIHGVDVTVLSVQAPLDPQTTLNADVLFGANDDVFFLATRPAAETILNGDGMLNGNRGYTEALQRVLPNPTSIWYADGEGLVMSTAVGVIVPLALLGPAIGNVFNNVVTELQAEGGSASVSPATPVPQPPRSTDSTTPLTDPAVVLQQIRSSLDALSSSSISATVTDDGVTLLRFVVTGAQQ